MQRDQSGSLLLLLNHGCTCCFSCRCSILHLHEKLWRKIAFSLEQWASGQGVFWTSLSCCFGFAVDVVLECIPPFLQIWQAPSFASPVASMVMVDERMFVSFLSCFTLGPPLELPVWTTHLAVPRTLGGNFAARTLKSYKQGTPDPGRWRRT